MSSSFGLLTMSLFAISCIYIFTIIRYLLNLCKLFASFLEVMVKENFSDNKMVTNYNHGNLEDMQPSKVISDEY